MKRPLFLVIGITCLVGIVYTAVVTYQHFGEWPTGQRLGHIGVVVSLGWIGGQCIRRA